MSPAAMAACAARGIGVAFLTERGRFLARVEGRMSTNVVVRRSHFRAADDPARQADIGRSIVAAKIVNTRTYLRRIARDRPDETGIVAAADQLTTCLRRLREMSSIASIRGIEGEAAAWYFGVVPQLLLPKWLAGTFVGRNRRPPRDPFNALISFLYAILVNDVRAALEATGLDPQVGFLHVDRPGRPSLALDLSEEFRVPLADRLAYALLNRDQLTERSFVQDKTSVILTDEARKIVLTEYQHRKTESLVHPYTKEATTVLLLPFVQARLMARTIRGELSAYPPYVAE
jgi:CRISPR-associated protein Cas1